MRRREFLVGGACGLAGACAGCTQIAPGIARHPFADSTVTVHIENKSVADTDVFELADRALSYWEAESEAFVGFDIEFERDEHNPDMEILFADDPRGCENVEGFSPRVLGCAPVLKPGMQFRRPATARVVAAARPPGKITITTKHEIGHILGLGHADEPRHIMSNRPADRIPLYEVRIAIWDAVKDAQEQSNDGTRLFNHAVEMWRASNYRAAGSAAGAAAGHYEDAETTLQAVLPHIDELAAQPQVETVNIDRLHSLMDRLLRRAELAIEFATALSAGAAGAATGDQETAQAEIAAANDALQRFATVAPVEIRDVAIALGLVRGFDDDEPVIDQDEEQLDEAMNS